MDKALKLEDLLALPAEERLAIASALWDSLLETPETIPIPDWHRAIIEQRLAEDDAKSK